jgi:hypothetical protein
MNTSSGPNGPKTVDKPTAWACTLANVVTVPGLGSLAAGRKTGYAQAALALAGFGLSFLGLAGFLRDWRERGEYPEGFTPSLWVALAGVGLFLTGWLWALRTSVQLHGKATPRAAPPPR